MIVPMKKITLLALEKDRDDVLSKLKKAGVLHVEKLNGTTEALLKRLADEKDLSIAKNLLAEFAPKKISLMKRGQLLLL